MKKTCTCRVCGSTFIHPKAGAAAYCSDECRKRRQATAAADWYARRAQAGPEFLAGRAQLQRQRREPKSCDIGGCEALRQPRGSYCTEHGNRTAAGYVVHKAGGTRVVQHRATMERILGRVLRPFENVHHKNGRKDDNRPSNLELWTKPQPAGQRPEDLVIWVIENYPEMVKAALSEG